MGTKQHRVSLSLLLRLSGNAPEVTTTWKILQPMRTGILIVSMNTRIGLSGNTPQVIS